MSQKKSSFVLDDKVLKLPTLNVYKILATEHHIVDSRSADEISVSEILF